MTTKIITQERLKELFSYNPETGLLIRIKKSSLYSYRAVGEEAGWIETLNGKKYRSIEIDRKKYLVHRIIWLFVYGVWPDSIDHINGCGTDNRMLNLRSVKHRDNMKNKRRYKNNKTGCSGVEKPAGRKYRVYISSGNKKRYLGVFSDLWDAICARKSAENKYGFHQNHGVTRAL